MSGQEPKGEARSGRGMIIGVVAFAVGAIAVSAWLRFSTPEVEAPPAVVVAPPVAAPAPVPTVETTQRPAAPRVAPPPAAPPSEGEDTTTPREEIEYEPASTTGEKSGLALFVRGTKPIKRGLLVPEDFPLPPGYMRHYQSTDDGESVPAILMFHPDYQPLDAAGKPIPIPENRVVPQELAPPGMPIQLLDLPQSESAP